MDLGKALGRPLGKALGSNLGPLVYGLRDFGGVDDRLMSAVDQAVTGDIAGFWVRILHVILAPGASSTRRLLWNSSGGNGFYLYTNTTNATLDGVCVVTGTVSVNMPSLTITSGMIGKLIDTWFVWDPVAGRLRHYYQGRQVGTGTASALAYLPPTGQRMSVGCRSNGTNFADSNMICGVEGGDGFIPTAADIWAAHCETRDRVSAGVKPLAGVPGKTTWRVNQGPAWNPPTTWADEIGSENLTMVVGAAGGISLGAVSGVFAPPL